MRLCDTEGCPEPHYARGMCQREYLAWWRSRRVHLKRPVKVASTRGLPKMRSV